MHDYVKQAVRTESPNFFGEPHRRLIHAALGLHSEFIELLIAIENEDWQNAYEEVGDICWYLAIMADELGVTFEEVESLVAFSDEDLVDNGVAALGKIADIVKRSVFYGTERDNLTLARAVGTILGMLRSAAGEQGWELEDIMAANIAKLKIRFPDKFTQNDAENRDLGSEQLALEI